MLCAGYIQSFGRPSTASQVKLTAVRHGVEFDTITGAQVDLNTEYR